MTQPCLLDFHYKITKTPPHFLSAVGCKSVSAVAQAFPRVYTKHPLSRLGVFSCDGLPRDLAIPRVGSRVARSGADGGREAVGAQETRHYKGAHDEGSIEYAVNDFVHKVCWMG